MVATLNVVRYENNIVNKCSSELFWLLLHVLINNALIILFDDSLSNIPLWIIGSGIGMFQQEMFCQMFNNIINDLNPFIHDQCMWIVKVGEDAFIYEYGCHYSCVHL